MNSLIDLRSDTVTRPSAGMRAAMLAADVGDDVYGDDPTVAALERRIADLTGKQAALFVSSGTQSNLIAMLAHCARGEEVITGGEYHVAIAEARGASVLGGIAMEALPTDAAGRLDPADIRKAIKPDNIHFAVSRLLVLENTVSGSAISAEDLSACTTVAREAGLSCHLDGARLFNASVALGAPVSAFTGLFDTVSLCLSKGLGAPVGSVLAGPEDFISRGRRLRKQLGGGMRQAGMLAAAGLYALDHNVERLAEDHARAARLNDQLPESFRRTRITGNMLFGRLADDDTEAMAAAERLATHLKNEGILISADSQIRLVTHLDVGDADIERIVSAFRSFTG